MSDRGEHEYTEVMVVLDGWTLQRETLAATCYERSEMTKAVAKVRGVCERMHLRADLYFDHHPHPLGPCDCPRIRELPDMTIDRRRRRLRLVRA